MAIPRRMYLFMAALFLSLAASAPVEGQDQGLTCAWCWESGGDWHPGGGPLVHHFIANGELCGWEGSGHGDQMSCARCGRTSTCHGYDDPGPCHIACGPEGDAMAALTEIREALDSDDVAVVASALLRDRVGVSVEFIPKSGRIDLLLPCDPYRPYHTIPVVPEVREALMGELQTATLALGVLQP